MLRRDDKFPRIYLLLSKSGIIKFYQLNANKKNGQRALKPLWSDFDDNKKNI